MRSLRNGIGSLLSAAILVAPGTTQAQSALLERTALDAAIGFDEAGTMDGLIASLAPQ